MIGQFFGGRVADAMEHLMNRGLLEFRGAEATIEFIRKINALVEALNSRLPSEGLRNDPTTKHYHVNYMVQESKLI